MALDSTSTVQLNSIKCQPYVSYTNDTDKVYALQLKIPKMKAQDFIVSLPTGLFRHFEGMEAQGNFSYSLNFEYNNHKPNALIFESKLKPEKLKITKYGEADLNKINGEFTYRAIDKGVAQRPIVVGPSNPNFTPLSSISPYLQKCVLTSEDPSFFNHRGFINEAFKQSIAKNIRTKKFSRGASTISMQLVKNAFLTREKTVSRKLEEILLVYILENNRISSKERMLEVYFNIIEWGPNIFGIGEAAQFYFQKSPADLNLNECLFLATIIPKPKGFMYRFDGEQKLKPFAAQQNAFLTKLMLRRQLLVETDTIGQNVPASIIGQARLYLKQKPTDSIQNDSINIDEFEF
jgi:Transglycosylase